MSSHVVCCESGSAVAVFSGADGVFDELAAVTEAQALVDGLAVR